MILSWVKICCRRFRKLAFKWNYQGKDEKREKKCNIRFFIFIHIYIKHVITVDISSHMSYYVYFLYFICILYILFQHYAYMSYFSYKHIPYVTNLYFLIFYTALIPKVTCNDFHIAKDLYRSHIVPMLGIRCFIHRSIKYKNIF